VAAITLAQAEAKLALWMEAEEKVASGQSYQIGARALRRADLNMIAERITYWESKVEQLTASGGRSGVRVRGMTPIG
jgi:hypothetical protein